jgi:hypothetical protein
MNQNHNNGKFYQLTIPFIFAKPDRELSYRKCRGKNLPNSDPMDQTNCSIYDDAYHHHSLIIKNVAKSLILTFADLQLNNPKSRLPNTKFRDMNGIIESLQLGGSIRTILQEIHAFFKEPSEETEST